MAGGLLCGWEPFRARLVCSAVSGPEGFASALSLSLRGGRLFRCRRSMGCCFGCCKLRETHGRWMQMMTQFKTKVPDPLRENLPELLSIASVGAPTVEVLFFIFIGKNRLTAAPVQVQIEHI